jgi:sulfhydrogenase subunit beta (sulfur reductase)
MQILDLSTLDVLFGLLRTRGYSIIAPTLRDGAIVYDEVSSTSDLPRGWTDEQAPGSYALRRRGDDALFGYVVSPYSWKKFLFPPRLKLFSAIKSGKGFDIEPTDGASTVKYAFIGVRACELSAIRVQDRIFNDGQYADDHYASTRRQSFIVAVNCVHTGGNCFCVSMKTGPEAREGFDLSLTEICSREEHYFVIKSGSADGESVLHDLPHRAATEAEMTRARSLMEAAAERMGRTLETENLPGILNDNHDNAHWDTIAKRCLACGNCTMVCPTCFCSTVEDLTDLTGARADRWRRWDSCFTNDFTKIAGGNIRMSTRTRYRQWLTHKLAHWVDQFDTFGCVGCGRCITWCPVGIDITEEARAIRKSAGTTA